MDQLPFHNTPIKTPPQQLGDDLPILTKLNETYKLWHEFLLHLPRLTRYTLGMRVDNLFTDSLELLLLAGYASRPDKLTILYKLSAKLDALKFFLRVLWEIKALDHKKYMAVSAVLGEVGKMAGGWMTMLKKQTLPN